MVVRGGDAALLMFGRLRAVTGGRASRLRRGREAGLPASQTLRDCRAGEAKRDGSSFEERRRWREDVEDASRLPGCAASGRCWVRGPLPVATLVLLAPRLRHFFSIAWVVEVVAAVVVSEVDTAAAAAAAVAVEAVDVVAFASRMPE